LWGSFFISIEGISLNFDELCQLRGEGVREKYLTGFALIVAILFVITSWALMIQSIGVDDPSKATIVGGILSMFGGLLGAIGAYFIAVQQINKQKEILEKKDVEENRAFIILEEFNAKPGLENVITNSESRLMSNEVYEENRRKNKDDSIPFYRVRHVGKSEIIIDCKIEINYDIEKHITVPKETIYLHVIEKGTEIFLPLAFADNETTSYPRLVKIYYKTMKNESILFEYNLFENIQKNILLRPEEGHLIINEIKLQKANWILPAKRR